MQTDFASLCVLSFNRRQFITETVLMLHERCEYPFELIVHDDGSTPDVTEELVKFHESGLISTLLLNPMGHNQGQGIALNRMFRIAKGDPIVKLDQDLVYREGWLRLAVDLLDSNREVSPDPATGINYKHTHGRRTEPRIGLLGTFHYHHEPCDSAKTRIEQFEGWSSRTHILGSGFAVTRECWDALGPFEEHSDAFAEDWDFQKRVTASRGFVCGLPPGDLVENRGFGVGPSTVVVNHDHDIQKICKEPLVYR